MTTATATDDQVTLLRRIVDALEKPAVPVHQQWWDSRAVGAYLDVSPRTVTEVYALRPGFPTAARLPGTKGLGPLRWSAKEIMQWLERHGQFAIRALSEE